MWRFNVFRKNTKCFFCCNTSSSTNVNWSFRLEKRLGREHHNLRKKIEWLRKKASFVRFLFVFYSFELPYILPKKYSKNHSSEMIIIDIDNINQSSCLNLRQRNPI
jgi:hypothetical protein